MRLPVAPWLVCGALAACSAPTDPNPLPGAWLSAGHSPDCSARPLAAPSPDGRWLAFWINAFDPNAGMRLPATAIGLIDLADLSLVVPQGQPQIERADGRRSLRPESLCWEESSTRWWVQSSAVAGRDGPRWYWLRPETDARLIESASGPVECRATPAPMWESHRPATQGAEASRGLQIIQPDCCTIELWLDGSERLARHESQRALSNGIGMRAYAWSPHRARLAYSLEESVSWRFALPSSSFVVRPGDTPRALDRPAGPFLWINDTELIACASDKSVTGSALGLRYWRFPEH